MWFLSDGYRLVIESGSGSGSRRGLREGLLTPTEASRHTCTTCMYKEQTQLLKAWNIFPESDYTTLLKNVPTTQYLQYSKPNCSPSYYFDMNAQAKKSCLPQINDRRPEEKKARGTKSQFWNWGHLVFFLISVPLFVTIVSKEVYVVLILQNCYGCLWFLCD